MTYNGSQENIIRGKLDLLIFITLLHINLEVYSTLIYIYIAVKFVIFFVNDACLKL